MTDTTVAPKALSHRIIRLGDVASLHVTWPALITEIGESVELAKRSDSLPKKYAGGIMTEIIAAIPMCVGSERITIEEDEVTYTARAGDDHFGEVIYALQLLANKFYPS